jgi:phage shock protein C
MKRLYRDKSDVRIAGVCSGIGKYLDVDPTAIRLAFVLLFFIGGGGLWIYLILWIIMPFDTDQEQSVNEVEPEEKAPEPKKIAQPKQVIKKKPTVNKTPAKKPADNLPPSKKPLAKPESSEEKKEKLL